MLEESVLILNRSWIPISVTNVKNAIVLIYQDAAQAVCPQTYTTFNFESWIQLATEDDHCIKTVSLKIPVMEIIRLTRYNGVPYQELAFTKHNLFQRDNYTCQYCGTRPKLDDLTIDHVVPRSRGGETHWENCVVACKKCNRQKGNALPKETKFKLLHSPLKPRWDLQFVISPSKFKESWSSFIPSNKEAL